MKVIFKIMRKIFILMCFLFILKMFFYDSDYDSFNRRVYSFNRGLEIVLIKPSLTFYFNILPSKSKVILDNFFLNVEVTQQSILLFLNNNAGQNFFKELYFLVFISSISICSFLRFNIILFDYFKIINTVARLLPVVYMVVPFIGPFFLNHFICFFLIQFFNPILYIADDFLLYYFSYLINQRSTLNYDLNFFHTVIFDGYSFLKDIFFQTKLFIK